MLPITPKSLAHEFEQLVINCNQLLVILVDVSIIMSGMLDEVRETDMIPDWFDLLARLRRCIRSTHICCTLNSTRGAVLGRESCS